MSKTVKVLIALALALVLATPAMADMKLNGYYRLQFISDNIGNAGSKDARTASQIDQRLRMKLTNTLNDYVSFVYYAEVDTPWGQDGSTPSADKVTVTSTSTTKGTDSVDGDITATTTTTNTVTTSKGESGGKDGADGVNLETKNVYLDVKIPNTTLKARAGIQGYAVDNEWAVMGDDVAGLRFDAKVSDTFDATLGYFKFVENGTTTWDDVDFYTLTGRFKPSDKMKLQGTFAYYDNNGLTNVGTANGFISTLPADMFTDLEAYYLVGIADVDFGMAALRVLAAYNGGTINAATGYQDVDIAGYMASAKVTAKLDPATVGLRLTYFSADDNNLGDNDWDGFLGDVTGSGSSFSGENLSIFFCDTYYNNTNGGCLAMAPAFGGNGLFAINATADVKLPAGYDLKAGAGYFSALEENGAADTDLGFEVAANFGRKLAEKVDVRLIGAYAMLGDFYNTTANNNDPDDIFLTKAVINVSF
ncbi:MAG: histidine kinase [Geothermobacteraceae bacterium]